MIPWWLCIPVALVCGSFGAFALALCAANRIASLERQHRTLKAVLLVEDAEKDKIKGMLLDKWINDLKHDRAPQWSPELRELSSSEIEEVMELARWFKGTFYPGQVTESEISAVNNTVMQKVAQTGNSEEVPQ